MTAIRSQKALGEALARLRYERDVTQEELAVKLGVSRRYISELESGRPTIYGSRLFEVLRDLGAHVEIVKDDQ
ncbi:helix-turn-helix transcriptional regulator [Nocardioides sp. cx-173]|uniref:helix-turn-helix transcriptional regulator n=1 Tax=Nocardioides sp. cx-173 TaxID=2898796 RepID=UPI001E323920|nr:helix-turn-helix transcriptional regulator [Nocardioides sp. cx-173]MCD4525224.1 helix-turn-helix domain-containing protein [Nocardioides sp. cx-173]UGB40973.1 helix-turn-helix domain-containing protein [Nocardioides sp. cx-173]